MSTTTKEKPATVQACKHTTEAGKGSGKADAPPPIRPLYHGAQRNASPKRGHIKMKENYTTEELKKQAENLSQHLATFDAMHANYLKAHANREAKAEAANAYIKEQDGLFTRREVLNTYKQLNAEVDEARQAEARAQRFALYAQHNAIIAARAAFVLALCEASNKWNGKQYGQATKQKIFDYITDALSKQSDTDARRWNVWTETRFFTQEVMRVCLSFGYNLRCVKIELYVDYEVMPLVDANNTIHAVTPDAFAIFESQLITDFTKTDAEQLAQAARVAELEKQLKEAINTANANRIEGQEHITGLSLCNVALC